MSDASRHALYQVAETVYGTTPATPAFDVIRHTGCTLGLSKDNTLSEELRADRQVACSKHGVRNVSGDIPFELSFGSFDDQLEAVTLGTWDPDGGGAGIDRLTAGVERRSFSVLRHFSDQVAGDKPYYLFTGVEYNTLSLTVAPQGILSGTFGCIGQDLAVDGAEPAGATFNAGTENCPFNGFSGVIKEGGTIISVVTELTLQLENGLEPRLVVGSDKTILPQIGRSTLTGQITAFFENSTLLEKFLDETTSSLEFELNDGTNKYVVLIPRITYTGGANPDTSGEGSITLALPFQALVDDATVNSNIQIDRSAV